ncbi:hypothetical protein KVR01_002543 [Diaporthe batatas]|uniref:uncharacterized protein n=1 Tax=Diaporthe batatas TaxID=748121 RepID=UPI001D04B752|nr:uncharacterized protein KVR01_002543 [Diaporthe batatas]KAG8166854.1 hypothetical protein KVR01_002543 [Diaporthe batatas]
MDGILSTGTGFVPHVVCMVILAFLGLSIHLSRRKAVIRVAGATATVDERPWIFQFPPSRRHILASLKLKGSAGPYHRIPLEVLRKCALPSTRAVNWDQDDLYYTPTGFSTHDIRALGRFPDYSVLTGVPYPKPHGPEFDIKKATFRPFRPFRWPYHQTMAHYKFDPDWWVELDQSYLSVMAQRKHLKEKHGELVYYSDPGTELACRELMEMLLLFICKRYPRHFSLQQGNTILQNRILNTRTDLLRTPPLEVIYQNIPEDYALVFRNEHDGLYHLRAAMVCSSVGWDIGMHRGKPLRMIHEGVPDYAEKMAFSLDRYFAKMAVEQPIQRCSWSLEDHAPLFSSPRMTQNTPWERSMFSERKEDLTIDDVKLRCDYQTLRRLPLSGAIVFNFKAVFTPITELKHEAYVPFVLLKVLQEGKESLIDYKTVNHVKAITIEACKRWSQEQIKRGIVPYDWNIGTLEESPFFPGWEEKWHIQQGF